MVAVARQLKGERVIIAKVNAEEAEKIATKFGVESYPTLMWYSALSLIIAKQIIYSSSPIIIRFVGGKKVIKSEPELT